MLISGSRHPKNIYNMSKIEVEVEIQFKFEFKFKLELKQKEKEKQSGLSPLGLASAKRPSYFSTAHSN